ncbi:hypothetical protein E8E14_003092 [Neopestalotiopsis sp. 37M]|nr:hypothetical protein E8E14_003092 [Neopestalotiopsis sp. 37M]
MSAVAGPSSSSPGPGQASLTGQSSGASPPSSLPGSSAGPGGSNTQATMLPSPSPSSPSFPPTGTNTTTASSSSWFGRNSNINTNSSLHHNQSIAPSQPSPRAVPTTASTSIMTTGSTHPVLHPNLPSPPLSPEQTAQARAALVGTISNLLDTELQGRASLLHANAKALEKQEKDVAKATEALRKETDKLVKVVKQGSEKVREAGDVQNWAEVLERDFLVLEDTLRQVRRGSGCSDPDCSGCSCSGGSTWTGGSRTPSRRGSFEMDNDGDGGVGPSSKGKGKGVLEDMIVSLDGEPEIEESGAVRGLAEALNSGRRESTFALVDNAIAASISEAMASSIEDRPTLMYSSATESGSSVLPSGSTTVVAGDAHDLKGKGVFSTGDVTASSSSLMELDGDCENDGHKEDDTFGDRSSPLGDRDFTGFSGFAGFTGFTGLPLQAVQEDGMSEHLENESMMAPEAVIPDPQDTELPGPGDPNDVEDSMDIDVPPTETVLSPEEVPLPPEEIKDDPAKSEEKEGI